MSRVRITVPFKENEAKINERGRLVIFRMAADCGEGLGQVKKMIDGFIQERDVDFEINYEHFSMLASTWDEIPIIYKIEKVS